MGAIVPLALALALLVSAASPLTIKVLPLRWHLSCADEFCTQTVQSHTATFDSMGLVNACFQVHSDSPLFDENGAPVLPGRLVRMSDGTDIAFEVTADPDSAIFPTEDVPLAQGYEAHPRDTWHGSDAACGSSTNGMVSEMAIGGGQRRCA